MIVLDVGDLIHVRVVVVADVFDVAVAYAVVVVVVSFL